MQLRRAFSTASVVSVILFACPSQTQSQDVSAPLVSPEVHPDRTVTFRIRASKAAEVILNFFPPRGGPQAMRKDAAGVWAITVGPMEPGIYLYSFSVDAAKVLDLAN